MIILKQAATIAFYLENQFKEGKKTGFVPTMGALHPGHLSLIKQSRAENDLTVCSIFVNPTQFNNPDDFKKYPITIEKDIDALEGAGCDLLFLPSVSEIYPSDFQKRSYELGYLETILEGEYRPGHFQGVCLVVHRLLDLVPCDHLYLGRKDYQQCMVIEKLTELIQWKGQIHFCETVRETDGLAMSSRNARLSAEERKQALAIYETLQFLKDNIQPGDLSSLKTNATAILTKRGFKPDYVALTSDKLELLSNWDGKMPVVALIAAYLNEVRLIDNMTIA